MIAHNGNSAIRRLASLPPPHHHATYSVWIVQRPKELNTKQGLGKRIERMFWTLATPLLVDLWPWPWTPLSEFLQTMHRWACLKRAPCCWLGSRGWCLPICPVSSHRCGWDFSQHRSGRAHTFSCFGEFVILRKAEHRIAGNHCCCFWPRRAKFPYWLFFFPASWGFGGICI